jgi:hypothetical protein
VAGQKAEEPGYYGGGGGLWMQISELSGKSWVFRRQTGVSFVDNDPNVAVHSH